MADRDRRVVYQPLTLVRLGSLLGGADESRRWRLIAEFLEEYRWEQSATRFGLLLEEPAGTGDERWDVFLAALADPRRSGAVVCTSRPGSWRSREPGRSAS